VRLRGGSAAGFAGSLDASAHQRPTGWLAAGVRSIVTAQVDRISRAV
jgi:hypothetical protein